MIARLLSALLVWGSIATADDAKIKVEMGGKIREFKASELLKSPLTRLIKIPADPAYGNQPREYRAIPAAELLKDFAVPPDATVVFHCLDGFSGPLSKDDLVNQSPQKAIAFIAIEEKKWTPLKAGSPATAGTFYLVWQDPSKSGIGREQWPFQLASLEVKPSLLKQYPKLAPSGPDPLLQAGFKGFIKNCFACHTLNGEGTSKLGPDLNRPYSPTEYMNEKYLRLFIRDPQKVRQWPESKMKGFSEKEIPEPEITAIINYLKDMAKGRSQ